MARKRFGNGVSKLDMTRHMYTFEYPFPPAEVVEFFRVYYAPANRAFAALDETGQAALRRHLERSWTKHNLATNGATHCEADYLHVTAVRA